MSPLRTLQLCALSIVGGGVLGALAGAAFFPPAGAGIGAIFGLVIGIISLCVIAPALAHKGLRSGALTTYLPAAVVAPIAGAFGPDVAIPVTGAALAAGALGAHCLLRDTIPREIHAHCPGCGHDVSASASARCPECGRTIAPPKPARQWSGPVVAWLVAVILTLGTLSFIAGVPAIERATIGFGAADPHQLMHHMSDPEARVRREAARRLAEIDPRLMLEALAHPEEGTRREAARSLRKGFDGDPWVVPALIEALADRSAFVRAEAAASLGALGDLDALPALRERAENDDSPMVVRGAREAIKSIERDPR